MLLHAHEIDDDKTDKFKLCMLRNNIKYYARVECISKHLSLITVQKLSRLLHLHNNALILLPGAIIIITMHV